MRLKGPLQYRLGDSRGSILVTTLWVLTILGIFAISVGYNVRQKITFADRINVRNALYGIAESGVRQAISKLAADDPTSDYDILNEPWSSEEKLFKNREAGEGAFSVFYEYWDPTEELFMPRYGAQDEESKINLNFADPLVISRILRIVADCDEDIADQIGYSVVDWRDTDSLLNHPVHGAEDDYYEDLDLPYEAKDNPFETVNEALLVQGMTPEILEKVRNKITVYGSGVININTVSKEVLLALGLSETLSDKVISFRAGTDQKEGTPDDRIFYQPSTITADISRTEPMPADEVAAVSNLVAANKLGTSSSAFMIHSRAEWSGKGVFMDIAAVVTRDGKVLSWSAGIPQKIRREAIETENQERPASRVLGA